MSVNATPTVLIVDDDPDISKMLRRFFETSGYAVITAETGAKAVQAATGQAVSVVLLDLGLPDDSGLAVLNKIKQAKPGLPIIMVTGDNDEEVAQKAVELGAWDYVTKPIDLEFLRNIVRLSLPPE